jgi:hypothetical protein
LSSGGGGRRDAVRARAVAPADERAGVVDLDLDVEDIDEAGRAAVPAGGGAGP